MNLNQNVRVGVLSIAAALFFLFPIKGFSQQTLTKINGWNAYVHLPDDYASTGSTTYPTIIFFPGIGEVGTDPAKLILNGPGHFIASGWNGNVVVNGVTVKPIIICLQPPATYPQVAAVDLEVEAIKKLYRVDTRRISMTGLSMGGWAAEMYVESHPEKISAVVAIQSVRPDDNPAYPTPFATYAKTCGHWLGYEQVNDGRDMITIYNTMKAAVPGSATYFQTNVGGGGHCCWNTWYDPTHTDNYSLNGVSGNWTIYQYLLTFSQCAAGNVAPTVSAGTAQNITLPTSAVTLNGTATGNNGATIKTTSWSQASGSAAVITTSSNLSTTITGLTAGTYSFKLTATDNNGLSSSSVVNVTVNAAPTMPPTVNGGSNQNITLPTNSVSVTGSASGNLGATIKTTSWSEISGGAATITTPSSLSTSITGLTAGTYIFKFTATDNNGLTNSANVTVVVNAAAAAVPPTVSAGSSQTVTLPVSSASLSGSATGNGGASIVSVSWAKISGNAAVIASPSSTSTTVTGLAAGSYVFQLAAKDSKGMTSTSNVSITVNSTPTGVVGCGCDITISPNPADGSAYLDGKTLGVKPGYKVCLKAGHYVDINLTNFIGTAAQPVTIINCGGLVTVSGYAAYGFGLHHGQYVHVTGTGDPNYKYGILIDGSVAHTSVGFAEDGQATNVELDHIEVSQAGLAIACAPTPSCDPTTWSTNWKMYNMVFHDNYVHDTFYEGFYIGNTQNDYNLTCNGSAVTVHPQQFDSVKFYNNIIDKSGWTSAQISQVVGGLDVHDNVITNFGYLNMAQHQAGLIVGGNSHGNVYRNKIISGTGNAFECFAAGLTKVFNNVFAYAGNDGTAQGQNAIVIDDRPRPAGLPPLQIYFVNNTIVSAKRVAITFYNDYKTVGTGNVIANNLISEPGYYSVYPQYAFVYQDAGISLTLSNNLFSPTNAAVKYADVTNKDFHLLAGSPAIDAGTNTGTYGVTSDLDNIPRPYGASYDIGAYEYHAGNQPPVARTGLAQTITLPANSATLDGTKSSDADGTISKYSWTQLSGPGTATLTNASSATASLANLIQGTYIFNLTVTDNSGATGSAHDTIIVKSAANLPPNANAGADQTITLPVSTVTVDGSASKDQDNGGLISAYAWSQISGPSTAAIATATKASTTISGLQLGTYVFKLLVTDASGATASDTLKVTVKAAANLPPISNAGADQTITLPVNSVTVDGSASKDQDNGGLISSYAWSQSSGPSSATIATATKAGTTISALVQGTYIFKLKVTDASGATATDSLIITVKMAANVPPVANAGTSKSITLPVNTVNLDGSLSTDADGTIASYSWAQISGPSTSSIANATSAKTAVNNLIAGQYTFELTVKDNAGASSKAQVKITVSSAGLQPPVANAGANQTIQLPVNQVALDGTGSAAPSGTITSYSWTQVSGPSSASWSAATASKTNATALVAGTYVFQLTVVDNNNAKATDQVTITVNAAANIPPVANAGSSITITLPTNTATLDGTKSSDADGTISTYSWAMISGPNTPGSTGSNSSKLSLTGLVAGQYSYQLTVTDNKGATATAQVKITVVAPANKAPIANAGTDRTITAPANSVNLDGSASSDPDGTIASYSWVLKTGTGSITISNGNTSKPSVVGLTTGTYSFQLTVTDNSGATSTDLVTVTVNPQPAAPNQAPVANAGNNQTITAPSASVVLNGSSSFDPDGTITKYTWTQVSGPNTGVVLGNGTVSPSVSGLAVGTYTFQLLVTDNDGATNTDQVTVTVLAAVPKVNLSPIAKAGPDTTIYLPTNTFQLNAIGSNDPDGNITTFQWQELSGPNTASASSLFGAKVDIGNLVAGVYQFQLTVTDNDGSKSTASVKITVVDNLSASKGADQFIVFPNPAHDVITGKLTSSTNGNIKVNVYDMNGRIIFVDQTVKTSEVFQKTYDISKMASGTYTIQIVIANKKVIVTKFIKD